MSGITSLFKDFNIVTTHSSSLLNNTLSFLLNFLFVMCKFSEEIYPKGILHTDSSHVLVVRWGIILWALVKHKCTTSTTASVGFQQSPYAVFIGAYCRVVYCFSLLKLVNFQPILASPSWHYSITHWLPPLRFCQPKSTLWFHFSRQCLDWRNSNHLHSFNSILVNQIPFWNYFPGLFFPQQPKVSFL